MHTPTTLLSKAGFLVRDVTTPVMTSLRNPAGDSRPKQRGDIKGILWVEQTTLTVIELHYHSSQAQRGKNRRSGKSAGNNRHECNNFHEHKISKKGTQMDPNLLLVRSGDVEENPGPMESEDKCYMCQKKFRTGTKPLDCASCHRKSHKKEECSKSKKGQSKEGWRCQECTPQAEETEEAYCRECGKKARKGQKMLECCECKDTVHKQETCSGTSRSRLSSLRNNRWKCKKCINPERYEREKQMEKARLEKTGSKEKRKCNICKKLIRDTHNCLKCSKCKSDIHLKKECSGESRDTLKRLNQDQWQCPTCTDREAEQEKRKTLVRGEGSEVEYVTNENNNKRPIRILQWNADSILTKREEFKLVLKEKKVDIFLVQETKMTTKDKLPVFPGYTVISKPRKQPRGKENNRGGGLMTGIKNNIPYREIDDINVNGVNDAITEWLTVEIPLGKKEKWRISNVYIPSERAGDCRNSLDQETEVSTRYWPCKEGDLIAGDMNAHSILWDSTLELEHRGIEVERGNLIEGWMDEKQMAVLNDGKTTHTNRKTDKESTPDLTIVHETQLDRYQWEVLEKLAGSDHKPILITREADGMEDVNTKFTYKWDLKSEGFADFREAVEAQLPTRYERKNTSKLEKMLRRAITKAAKEHIGVKKVGKDSRPAITKEIKLAMEERNRLRRDYKKEGGRHKWIEKCKEVNSMIRKEKEERWKEYVSELDTKTDSRQVWRTIRNLDGRVAPRKENEVLVCDGKAYVGDRQKAKQFAKVYKKVSKISKGPRDRTIKRKNREFLNERPQTRTKYETEITWEELERVITDASTNKAAGDDDIPYDIIKALGPRAKKSILHIYNKVWNGEQIPQRWRTAVIKPLLKEGKDPKAPGSFRPIALTACLGKLLEKIVADRLSAFMETNNLLNPNQAGFRKERCTTDQVLKLVQVASDKIHENKEGSTTLVTFFDFSRAYDKVWREGLISKMIKLNVPYQFIKYTRLFLSARRTVVDINGVKSDRFYLNEGLPQGSAISPLLFLLFINDITEHTQSGATPSLFADDTSVWIEATKDKEKSVKNMQENIDGISEWSKKWKMVLNSDKTQVMVITTGKNDKTWKPTLKLDGKALEVVEEYRFLGVIIDNGLTFNAHVKKVIAKCRRRNNILRCLAGKDWGQSMETQRALYCTYVRAALEYASPAWYPWISETAKKDLERVQNESLRIMTRMAKDTPVEFLRFQTGMEPIMTRLDKNSRILREKYMRLDHTDSRRKLAEKQVRRRIKSRIGWRVETKDLAQVNYCREIKRTNVDPMTPLNIEMAEVKLERKKDTYSEQELRQLTELKIAEVDADVEIFTDGSTSGDQRNGGAGIFIQNRTGETLVEMAKPAGVRCSSYDGETVACIEALKWIREQEEGRKYAIYTDSKSLVQALMSNKWKDTHEWIREVKSLLQSIKQQVIMCWVPSHCGTYGNEKADKLADSGAKMCQRDVPVTFSIIRAKIRNEKWPVGGRAAPMFGERRNPKEEEKNWPESVQRAYGRIRSGHATEQKEYRKRIGTTESGICIFCDLDEEETVEHVLCKCPQLEVARRKEWPEAFTTHMLVTNPEICRKVLGRRYPALRRLGVRQNESSDGPTDRWVQQA